MKLHKLLTSVTLFLLLTMQAHASGVTIKQSLDSAYILMGRTTTLNIEILSSGIQRGLIVIPDKDYPEQVELRLPGTDDTTAMGNDRYEIRRKIIIQSFDSGLYTLPPVLYINGDETIASAPLALKVVPVPVDTLTDIHDYADVYDVNTKWYDNFPDWMVDYGFWILLTLIIISVGAWWLIRKMRKKDCIKSVVNVKKEPPYDVAVRELNELRDEHLCENGLEREYYTRLTEILRVYLQNRFSINAMEMTSSQILDELERDDETRMGRNTMNRILEMADFVKFAKVRPLPDDNVNTWKSAMKFVEETKPIAQLPETSVDNKSNNGNKSTAL